MTQRINNISTYIIMAIMILATGIVGAALIFHPWSDTSSAYFGTVMIVVACTAQVLLMMRGS